MALPAAVSNTGGSDMHRRKPGLLACLILLPLVAWLLLFVVAPTVMLIVVSFAERDALGRIVYEFNLQNYARAFDWVWLKVMLLSIWYALLTTILCMALGFPVAYFIGRAPERWRTTLLLLVMVPFWTSFLIRTYAWITILSKDGLLNALLVGSGILTEPEAAYDLGAGPVRAFSQVIIPLTRPGIAAGAMLVFIPSIAMFAITTLMGGGSNPTIGEVIFKQFTSGRNQPFGAALGTLLLVIFLLALWLTNRQREERS